MNAIEPSWVEVINCKRKRERYSKNWKFIH
jgi:hypothetical protein